ncbi:MAG: septum formation protein Maf [Bacteroidaceae bacterium]|nr:septum formation protein Maf [Bacteroidaceae bacterium]
MNSDTTMRKIVLASNSPRRRELLGGLGYDYEVRVLDGIDESYPDTLRGSEVAAYISRAKADAYRATMADDEIVITADTIVCLDDMVLGKPADEEEAVAMLRSLSGRTHQVYTGVTIVAAEKSSTFVSRSDVVFATLTDEEIKHYVTHYRPMDKAGAYGIQEWIGYIGVERIEGSYFNVMGLPVQRLYTELKKYL